jgi:hypothetical protein
MSPDSDRTAAWSALLKLERRHQEKDAALEAKSAADRAEISRLRKEHEEKVAAFNTREYAYVRREVDKKLEKILTQYAKVSIDRTTERKRWAIHIVCVAALLASATVAGFAL